MADPGRRLRVLRRLLGGGCVLAPGLTHAGRRVAALVKDAGAGGDQEIALRECWQ